MRPGICYALDYQDGGQLVPVTSRVLGEAFIDWCRVSGRPVPVLVWSFTSSWLPIKDVAA